MIARKCTVEDLVYILNHPLPATKQEIVNFDLALYPPDYIAERFLENNFDHNLVIVDDMGNPIWAFGMAIFNYTDWTCWALYSDTFPLHKKEAIKLYNEKFIEHAKLQRQIDGKFEKVILVTAVDSRQVARWCKTIGFNKATDSGIKDLYDDKFGVYVREFYRGDVCVLEPIKQKKVSKQP